MLVSITNNNHKNFFHVRIIVSHGIREMAKEKVLCYKKPIKIWDVNVDTTVISKLVKTKTNSKYLIGHLGKAVRSMVLIMLKMSRYVETFKV